MYFQVPHLTVYLCQRQHLFCDGLVGRALAPSVEGRGFNVTRWGIICLSAVWY